MKAGGYLYAKLTEKIIGAAYEVHNELGSGFLEYVYEIALCYELKKLGMKFKRQVDLDIYYKEFIIPKKYKADIIIENKILIELKATKALNEIDVAQLIHYLKATKIRVGLLLNFGAPSLEVRRRIC